MSSIPTLDVARWGRAARIARIIRVLRGVRATRILANLALARRTESTFLAVALIAILLLTIGSISILQLETAADSNIKTADDALWWALTTITTVANTYFTILATQDRLRIARNNLAAATRILELIKQQFSAGTSSDLNVAQQESLVETVRQLRSGRYRPPDAELESPRPK